MKTLLLTPGTGNFHCGSCLHDESLVRAMRKLGHDAFINALYLPLVLDSDDDIDAGSVQMGGISMYLQAKSAVFRHTPAFLARLLDRPIFLRKASSRADMTSPSELGWMTEQMLLGRHGKTRIGVDRLLEHLRESERPDVVLLNNALLIGLAEPIADELGCAVACTLHGEDTFIDGLPEPWRSNVWNLLREKARRVDAFMPVSAYHQRLMADRLAIPEHKLRVVHNGIEVEHYTPQKTTPTPPVIGYLARMCAGKGLGTLIDAYILMHERGLAGQTRLHLVGAATPNDQRYVDMQHRKLADAGLADRVLVETNVSFDDKIQALRGMSVLSVPATYGESFGLYVLEANAMGVPVVEPDHAGLAEVIGHTGGGILYEAGNTAALAEALAALIQDEPRRRALGEQGRAAVLERFTATRMAESVATVLEALCQASSA